MVRGEFLGEIVGLILRKPRWQILRHVAHGRGGEHRTSSVVPIPAGEHPRRECHRRVDPNIGA